MASVIMENRVRLRRYKRIFQKVHATIPERAIIPSEHGIAKDRLFNLMVARKIFVAAGNDKFFYNSLREKQLIRKGSLQVVLVLVIIIVLTYIFFLWRTP